MKTTKCELKRKSRSAVAIADIRQTWNDVMTKVEQIWPSANAATVHMITAEIVNKSLKL